MTDDYSKYFLTPQMPLIHITLCLEKLEPASVPFPEDGATGAVVEFYGIVRGRERGHEIDALHYEAYEEMARKQFGKIIAELNALHPVHSVAITHRVGDVPVGEPSLHVRVRSAHRAEAFAFASRLIDRMKEDVPIWKSGAPQT
jgi:molybdopterin synthase catalytic subunit